MSFAVRRVQGTAECDAALALRHRVFCLEQGVPEAEESDGRDDEGLHLVAVEARGEEVIGTCRLLFISGTVQFSRLAVERAARRRGVAGALLAAAEEEARRRGGVRRMLLHAQTYAAGLYRGAGWEPRGSIFVEAGIEHVAMEKALA